MNKKTPKKYIANVPRRCTKCKERIKIGMPYYIPCGASIICSDCLVNYWLTEEEKEKVNPKVNLVN